MTTYSNAPARSGGQSFSIPSIVAILAAIGSFFTGSGILTIVLAVSALVAGVIGVILALSPNVRGGLISTIAILLSVVAAIIGVVRGVSNVVGSDDTTVNDTTVVAPATPPAPGAY